MLLRTNPHQNRKERISEFNKKSMSSMESLYYLLPVRTLEEEAGSVRALAGITTPVHRLAYIPSLQVPPTLF
jgi:hypothetical protein